MKLTYHVDGSEIRRAPVEVGSLFHYLQGFYIQGGAGFQPSTVAPENGWLEDVIFLLGSPPGRCYVSLREGTCQ